MTVWRLALEAIPSSAAAKQRVYVPAARLLRITPGQTRLLLTKPGVLPRELTEAEAQALVELLRVAGFKSSPREVPHAGTICAAHPTLVDDALCATCRARICPLCRA